MPEDDDGCIGPEGVGGCRFAPVVFIAGDRACAYHVVTVTKMRLRETKRPLKVEVIPHGPWAPRG